jgi:hypothetical protein
LRASGRRNEQFTKGCVSTSSRSTSDMMIELWIAMDTKRSLRNQTTLCIIDSRRRTPRTSCKSRYPRTHMEPSTQDEERRTSTVQLAVCRAIITERWNRECKTIKEERTRHQPEPRIKATANTKEPSTSWNQVDHKSSSLLHAVQRLTTCALIPQSQNGASSRSEKSGVDSRASRGVGGGVGPADV